MGNHALANTQSIGKIKLVTVEPRLAATSLLRPLFWLPGKNRYIQNRLAKHPR